MTSSASATLDRRQWLASGGITLISLCASPSLLLGSADGMMNHRSPSTKAGFFSNAFICEGPMACILIDAHLTPDGAKNAANRIREIGKPLSAIIITHPHPDHYLGLENLGPMFPDAVVASSEAAIDVVRDAATGWANFYNPMKVLKNGPLSYAGITFECLLLQDAESIGPVLLYDARTKILISGDHVLNDQHLWLAEDRLEAWQENLQHISDRWDIDLILPGHGPIGDAGLLAKTSRYLEKFMSLKSAGADLNTARSVMLETFPNHVFREALETSLTAHF